MSLPGAGLHAPSNPAKTPNHQGLKGLREWIDNKGVLVGLVVLVLIAVGAGGWFYMSGQNIGAPTTGDAAAAAAEDLSEKAAAVPVVDRG